MKKPLIICLADCLTAGSATHREMSKAAPCAEAAVDDMNAAKLLLSLSIACREAHTMYEAQEGDVQPTERSERVIGQAKHHAVTDILLGLYFLANDRNPPAITSATELSDRKKEQWGAYRNDPACHAAVNHAAWAIMETMKEVPQQPPSEPES